MHDASRSGVHHGRSLGALALVVVLIGAVPLALDRDSFPLSTYPMFSTRRTSSEAVDTAVVVDPAGHDHRLTPMQIADTDEIILAAMTVSDAVRSGEADALCRDIARRATADVGSSVEVVTLRYDALAWYDGDRTPLDRIVHARCPVPVS